MPFLTATAKMYTFFVFIYILFFFLLTAPATERFGIESYYYSIPFFFTSIVIFLFVKFSARRGMILFFILALSLLFSGLFNMQYYKLYFSEVSFLSSYMNLFMNIVISLSIYALVSNKKINLESVINWLLIVVMVYALIEYLLLKSGYLSTNTGDFYRMYERFPIIVRGFFNEPSSYTSFISLLLVIKLYLLRSNNYLKIIFLLSSVTVILSLSISGMLVIVTVWLVYFLKHNPRALVFTIGLTAILVLILDLSTIERLVLLFDRLDRIFTGSDGSSSYRLFETWAFLPYFQTYGELLFGVGLGNMGNYSLHVMGYKSEFVGVNVFANVLFSGGVLFLILLLIIIFLAYRKSIFALGCFVCICFIHGYIVGPYLFPMICLALAVSYKYYNRPSFFRYKYLLDTKVTSLKPSGT